MTKLSLLTLVFTSSVISAAQAMYCGDVPQCRNFGYTYSACINDGISCPFDNRFKQCDGEASVDDVKLSIAPAISSSSCEDETCNWWSYCSYGKVYAYAVNKEDSSISSSTKQNAIPADEPTCASMGYVDRAADCPGGYVKCPLDTTAVLCDMEAKAGEIKYSLQINDHNGWLLCDGRLLSEITSYKSSELTKVLCDADFTESTQMGVIRIETAKLPDYSSGIPGSSETTHWENEWTPPKPSMSSKFNVFIYSGKLTGGAAACVLSGSGTGSGAKPVVPGLIK